MYNLTSLYAANNTIEQITAFNTISGNVIFTIAFFAVYLILIIVFKKDNMKAVLMSTSFMVTIIATIMFYQGWINFYFLIIPIMVLFISLFAYLFTD